MSLIAGRIVPKEVEFNGNKFYVTGISEAFTECENLDKVIIHGNIKTVSGFSSSSVKEVVLEDGVEEIGGFNGCYNLSSISLPPSVKTVNDLAFFYSGLETIEINSDITWGTSVFFSSNIKTIDLSASTMTYLPSSIFYYCCDLESVILSDTMTKIGESAFYSCSLLKSIDFPDSLTEIGGSAFQNCYSLESIDLPKSLTVLSESVFLNCTSLKSVELPEPLTRIEGNALCKTGIKTLRIPKNVTYISNYAFNGCSELESAVFEDGCTAAGGFMNCTKLTKVTLPESIIEIGSFTNYYCPLNFNVARKR